MNTLHAEWTKLRSEGGTGWLLLATIGLTVGLSAAVVSAVSADPCSPQGCSQDVAKLSLTGMTLGQAVVAVLAVLTIGNEYSTGMIRTTLAAMPNRSAVLAAKAAVLSAVLILVGSVCVLGSLLVGRLLLPSNGFTVANGYSTLSLTDGPTLRAVVGSVLYFVLIGLLSLGVATAVRDSAVGSGIVLALLYIFPILSHVVRDPVWQKHLQQIAPMSAGLAVQATTGLSRLPISPWLGLGVLAVWAAVALLVGGLGLRLRDA